MASRPKRATKSNVASRTSSRRTLPTVEAESAPEEAIHTPDIPPANGPAESEERFEPNQTISPHPLASPLSSTSLPAPGRAEIERTHREPAMMRPRSVIRSVESSEIARTRASPSESSQPPAYSAPSVTPAWFAQEATIRPEAQHDTTDQEGSPVQEWRSQVRSESPVLPQIEGIETNFLEEVVRGISSSSRHEFVSSLQAILDRRNDHRNRVSGALGSNVPVATETNGQLSPVPSEHSNAAITGTIRSQPEGDSLSYRSHLRTPQNLTSRSSWMRSPQVIPQNPAVHRPRVESEVDSDDESSSSTTTANHNDDQSSVYIPKYSVAEKGKFPATTPPPVVSKNGEIRIRPDPDSREGAEAALAEYNRRKAAQLQIEEDFRTAQAMLRVQNTTGEPSNRNRLNPDTNEPQQETALRAAAGGESAPANSNTANVDEPVAKETSKRKKSKKKNLDYRR
ncbi:hypothetical protein FRC19_007728 [Serendipita sp. 401]|nr:hypothetical protein FRC19_007728 [Serendipita sp. 401]